VVTRSLSRVEARIVLPLEAERREVVRLAEIRRLGRLSPGFARKVAHDLVRKGWLQRVRRGVYLVNAGDRGPEAVPDADPLRIGSHLVDPYYFGFGTAAQLRGLLPRAGPVYFLASPARATLRPVGSAQFRLVRCPRGRFFGSESLVRRGSRIRVSDRERTVLDCVSRPDLAGGIEGAVQIVGNAKPAMNWRKLASYLRRWRNRSLQLRVGFLAEVARPDLPVPRWWRREFRARVGEGFVPLGPPRQFGRRGRHDPNWHVIQNVPRRQLFGEVERP
jgi:predicted transcriptional regulator of viral defense system